jgi:hypothetical protein
VRVQAIRDDNVRDSGFIERCVTSRLEHDIVGGMAAPPG